MEREGRWEEEERRKKEPGRPRGRTAALDRTENSVLGWEPSPELWSHPPNKPRCFGLPPAVV